MKIVAGLGCIDDYPAFCEAGADEFSVGMCRMRGRNGTEPRWH
ncbi:hypothetical protein [Blautia faecicola]